ncbi:hypothetical protein GCM10022281_13130 [Sphingomonas rosea]|uniref:DUF2306 domain-containing protein n=1 Tax=Sphingomonas rosea TaxID=335605 RepID=A0ABP7U202_9SPHN
MAPTDRAGLARYRDLYLWMLIPMAVMQLGILRDYWGDFSDNAWPVHVHYWTATLWYLLLIVQPRLATTGRMAQHRTWGMIGFFLAGGVAFTALAALNRDIVNAGRAAASPDQFGPFKPWFFYGIAAVEFVMMSAFIVAIVQAIRHRKRLEDHAWWLVSSVFIIMMPTLGRGMQFLWFMIGRPEDAVTLPLYVSTAAIVALLAWAARRYGRFNHPATWLALGANLFNLLFEPLGKWVWLQGVLRMIIKD